MKSGLGKKFFWWFLIISLIPLAVVSIVSYRVARESLIRDTSKSLAVAIEFKKRYIEAFFDEKIKDLDLQASLTENVQFLDQLRQLRQTLHLPGNEFVLHPRWNQLVEQYRPDLERFRKLNDYHDVLFIDTDGNILYTVTNEVERGKNIFSGPLANSLFTKTFERSLSTGRTLFSDMEPKSHVEHALDSFLVRVVRNREGETIGVMALEISLDQIDRVMQDRTGMGRTGETFLVGSDLLMRSDSWQDTQQTALRTRINSLPVTQLFADELADKETVGGWQAQGVSNYINHRGTSVFGTVSNLESLDRFDTHWVVVAEIAEAEALALVARLRLIVFLLFVGTALLVAVISGLASRGIVLPIRTLSKRAGRVAEGDLTPIENHFPENEIGDLYLSFNRMVQSFQDVTSVCEAVAVGNFNKSVELRGKKDSLGLAVNQMAENLRAAVFQADAVGEGDFSVKIIPRSEKDLLGVALLRMTRKLREMDEANRKALADVGRLADYLDKLPTPVVSMDRDFRIVYLNNAGAALAGRDLSECIGRHCYEFFHNDHCRTKKCRVWQAMHSRQIEQGETVIDLNALNIPIRYTGAPIIGKNDEVIGALEYIVDISESRKAFAIIEKENWIQSGAAVVNDRLRGDQSLGQLCDNLLSGLAQRLSILAGAMYVVEKDTLQLYGTYSAVGHKNARERFNLGEGLVGQAAREKKTLVVDDVPDDCVHMVSGTVEAIPRYLVVVPLLHEDQLEGVLELGSLEEFDADAITFLERVADNIAIALSSVQARMQLAELLAETQRQAQELQTQQEELQATNEELEAQTLSLKKREAELQSQHEELMALNEELEEKTESLQRQKTDIEQKNRELETARRDIEKKAEEVSIASKYKSEFMANMSHELRTPLNSLLLLSHNLSRNKKGNLTDEQIDSARVIHSSGNDLLELINDILDLSKIEAGRVEVEVSDVSLHDLTERLLSTFQAMTDDKGLVFTADVDPKAPAHITTDRQRLDQILRNLISNAIKFTEKGGISVTIRPISGDDAPTREGLSAEKALAIAVTDSGIGIPPEKQKTIFEAFQQVDGSTSRRYGGTGLGLSISRELAELLDGEIQLTSTPGRGSTFVLYLPLALARQEKEKSESVVSPAQKPPLPDTAQRQTRVVHSSQLGPVIDDDRQEIAEDDKTVLIIEDDLNFVRCLINQGHENGFKCLASADGRDGLLLAGEYHPSAIILDINLPDMNGWEVLDVLKKNRLLRHIPVHMMSAEDKTLDAFKKGAVGYLHKPVTQEDLLAAFDRLEDFIDNDIRELLVVEDDKILRREIVKLIGNSDVNTTAVASGKEVVEVLRQHKFDCMILDIGLPDMTGFELLDLLEKEIDIEIPPVIVYTGRELTREEHDRLYRYTDSIIIKGVKSVERLLDETALFLHRVVDKMPDDKRKMIASLYEQDAMFIGKKVLIVDDDMRNAFALSKILAEKQMDVLIATSGFKALEILDKEESVDLVLMDIMMPEMDGYETMHKIRAQERFWNLPVIALTAKAMPDDKRKCLESGANDYLAKPIEEARLFSVMRIWLYR